MLGKENNDSDIVGCWGGGSMETKASAELMAFVQRGACPPYSRRRRRWAQMLVVL